MIARYMRERPYKVKRFHQESLTIPGLGTSPEDVIQACKMGQPVRVHQSGSFDDDPSLDRISPFQRGFEITDMASSPQELNQQLSSMKERLRSEQKRTVTQPAQSAAGAAPAGTALGAREEPGSKPSEPEA